MYSSLRSSIPILSQMPLSLSFTFSTALLVKDSMIGFLFVSTILQSLVVLPQPGSP